MFTVLKTIWHSQEKKQYEAGEETQLGHLAQGQIDALIANGVVVSSAEFRLREVIPAEKLRSAIEAGVTTLEDLASAPAGELARKLDASAAALESWQAGAKTLLAKAAKAAAKASKEEASNG